MAKRRTTFPELSQQALQFGLQLEFDETQLAQQANQFAKTHGLDIQRFSQDVIEQNRQFKLEQTQVANQAAQFAKTYGLDVKKFTQDVLTGRRNYIIQAGQLALQKKELAQNWNIAKLNASTARATAASGGTRITLNTPSTGGRSTSKTITTKDIIAGALAAAGVR